MVTNWTDKEIFQLIERCIAVCMIGRFLEAVKGTGEKPCLWQAAQIVDHCRK